VKYSINLLQQIGFHVTCSDVGEGNCNYMNEGIEFAEISSEAPELDMFYQPAI